jgi:hypothetical protein
MNLRILYKLPVLRRFSSYRRHRAIARVLEEIRRLPKGQPPERELIRKIHAVWGNPDYSASVSYLEAAARHAATTKGPLLECGSGLSTLLLGALGEVNGFDVWTLEHDVEWHRLVALELERHKISNVHLCLAPLKDFGGGVSWYDSPLREFPQAFSLVICDGPPNWTTPGARYGVVAVIRDRLPRSWNILLDDARAAGKTGTLSRLAEEPGISITTHTHSDGSFLWITRREH